MSRPARAAHRGGMAGGEDDVREPRSPTRPPSCQSASWMPSVNAVKLSPPQIALTYCQPLKASQK
jgi:hypothetical protein